jgi:hypothetical protein
VLIFKNRSEEHAHCCAKPLIYDKQYDKGDHKDPKYADEYFQHFENYPKGDQACEENSEWIFK